MANFRDAPLMAASRCIGVRGGHAQLALCRVARLELGADPSNWAWATCVTVRSFIQTPFPSGSRNISEMGLVKIWIEPFGLPLHDA